MNANNETDALGEKHVNDTEKHVSNGSPYVDPETGESGAASHNILHRDLKGRHMQMIAMWV